MTSAATHLEEMTRSYAEAAYNKDVDGLVRLYDERVRIYDAWSDRTLDGRETWRSSVAAWLESLGDEKVQVSFNALQAEDFNDIAVVTGIVSYAGLSPEGKVQRSLDNRLTWTLRKTAEGWRIMHEHTSLPIDHTTLRPILRLP